MPARSAPARQQVSDPVWLPALVVIGRLNALGYADDHRQARTECSRMVTASCERIKEVNTC